MTYIEGVVSSERDVRRHPFERTISFELEERAAKLSFMFDQMGKIIDGEYALGQEEIQGLFKYSDEHRQIMIAAQGAAFDVDHTLSHDPRLLVSEFAEDGTIRRKGDIRGENLPQVEQENLQMLAVLSLAGMHISLLTGRDVYAHPTAIYVQQKMDEFADVAQQLYKAGDARGINFQWIKVENQAYSRPSTIHGDRPAVLMVGSCNGVEIRDVWDNYKRVGEFYSIEDNFWLTIANDKKFNGLLRDSTDKNRLKQMKKAFPRGSFNPETHVDYAILKLRKYMNVSENRGKANLVIDTHIITRKPRLQARWEKETGVRITEEDKGSFLRAFNILMEKKFGRDESNWPFETTKAISNGQRVIDIIPRNVNKGSALNDIRSYVSTRYREYFDNEAHILTVGDNHLPGSNDNPMLEDIRGSVSCSGNPKHGAILGPGNVPKWPVLLRDLPGLAERYETLGDENAKTKFSVDLTNIYLRDLIVVAAFRQNQAAQLSSA